MCQDVPSSAPNITAGDTLSLCSAKEIYCAGYMCTYVRVSMRACVALPLAALSVSRLCWGLSKQSCSQKLLAGFTEQEVGCFVSQGEPLRHSVLLSLTCLALNPSSSSGRLGSSWQSLEIKRCRAVSLESIFIPVSNLLTEGKWKQSLFSLNILFFVSSHVSRSFCNCSRSEWFLAAIVQQVQLTCLLHIKRRNNRSEHTTSICYSGQNSNSSLWHLLEKTSAAVTEHTAPEGGGPLG